MIKRLRERIAYSSPDNPWVRLYFDDVQFSGGHLGRYNRIVEGSGRNGVAVLPFHSGSLLLGRHFRYPVGAHLWEIPRGFGEASSPEDDARRELHEETGLVARSLSMLGSVCPNSGLLAGAVHVFFAEVESPDAAQPAEDEFVELKWHTAAAVRELLCSAALLDGITLSAICLAAAKGILAV